MDNTLGIDIGASKIALGVVDKNGHVIEEKVIAASQEGPETNVEAIVEALQQFKRKDFRAAGVGTAGQIDAATGTVLSAPNLRWKNFPLKQVLEKKLGIPVKVLNDVRAATYGEWHYGAGKGSNDVLCVFIGTGLGGGIVSGGRLIAGANNSAGEIGHMIIDRNGRECSCGSRGCLESIASGWAVAKRAKEVLGDVTAKDVIEMYRKGNAEACKIVEEVMDALVVGVTGLVNVLGPECVVVGGGIAHGLPEIVEVLRREVPKRALPAATAKLHIVPSKLGPHAGLIGAATYFQ